MGKVSGGTTRSSVGLSASPTLGGRPVSKSASQSMFAVVYLIHVYLDVHTWLTPLRRWISAFLGQKTSSGSALYGSIRAMTLSCLESIRHCSRQPSGRASHRGGGELPRFAILHTRYPVVVVVLVQKFTMCLSLASLLAVTLPAVTTHDDHAGDGCCRCSA